MHQIENEIGKVIRIAGGFSSVCFTDGSNIQKNVDVGLTPKKALKRLSKLESEYILMKSFLGENVLDTSFKLGIDNRRFVVRLQQKYLTGIPLREVLNPNDPKQNSFLRKCLNLYNSEGIIPDIIPDIMPDPSMGITLTKKYTYRSGPNVLLVDENPILIDTTLNRGLRNPITGPLFSSLIALRIKDLLGII
jgi:hypothetical protein